MNYSGKTELLEWELYQADGNFEMDEEEDSWVPPESRNRFGNEAEFQSPEKLRSAPNNWRKNREFLSPVEGAHEEGKMDDEVEDIGNGDISLPTSAQTEVKPQNSIEEEKNNLSGGDNFQAMDSFGEDTYYYDEDLTTRENPNTEFRSETQSNTDLIFRSSTMESQWRDRTYVKYLRYFLMAVLALGAGCFLGYLIAKATNQNDNNSQNTTTSSIVYSTTNNETVYSSTTPKT
ncbi:uncharacterized protein LOC120328364 [Styela clava]